MRLIKKMLKQKAVYWAPRGIDRFGQKEWEPPEELNVRWEDVQTRDFDTTGVETVFTSTVFVEKDLELGGMLLFATIDDLEGNVPPEEALEIRKWEKFPTLNAKQFVRTAYI